MKQMFIAVELDDDLEDVNDTGELSATPGEAWENVSHMFDADLTLICKVTPVFTVQETRDTKFNPIKKEK